MFALASVKGARAGELMALTVPDLDFLRKTIRVDKSVDDLIRDVRQPKTRKSVALPPPSYLETMRCEYLKHHWKENSDQLLFPASRKLRGPLRTEAHSQFVIHKGRSQDPALSFLRFEPTSQAVFCLGVSPNRRNSGAEGRQFPCIRSGQASLTPIPKNTIERRILTGLVQISPSDL